MKKLLAWFDHNLLLGISAFLTVFIPLMPKLPLFDVLPGYIVRVRIEDFLISFAILVWLVYLVRGKTKLNEYPLSKPILVYCIGAVLSIISAVFILQTVPLQATQIGKTILHFLRRVEYFSLFFIFFSSIRSTKQLKILITLFVITVVGVAIYGFGQKYLYWPAYSTMNREFAKGWQLYLTEHARVLSTFGGHYDLAAYIMMALVLLWSLFFSVKRLYLKFAVFVIISMSFWTLILTVSRTSFIAYLAGISVLFFIWSFRKGLSWALTRWLGVFLLSMIVMLSFGSLSERFTRLLKLDERFGNIKTLFMSPIASKPNSNAVFLENDPQKALNQITSSSDMPPSIKRPTDVYEDIPLMVPSATDSSVLIKNNRTYSQTAFQYDLSTAIRLDALWPMAINGFKRNPILGSGYATLNKLNATDFTEAESTDNDFLRTLGETGLVGFISLYGTVFLSIYLIWRNLKLLKDPVIFGVCAGFIGLSIGLLVNAIYIDVFVSSKVAFTFWGLSGMVLAALMVLKREEKGKIPMPEIPHLLDFLKTMIKKITQFVKSDIFIVLVLLILSFYLRIYKINTPLADWHSWRQADTASVTRGFVKEGIRVLYPAYHDLSNIASGKDNPNGFRMVEFPLYNVFSTIVDKIIVGYTIEISGRLTSIFASLSTLVLIFLLVRRFIGRKEAFIASFFFAVLPYNIFYSRVILPEPLLVTLSTGMIFFFDTLSLKIKQKENIGKIILLTILALVFAVGAALVKPISFFLYPVIIYLWIYRFKISIRSVVSIGSLLFITTTPFLLWRQWILQFPEGIPAYTWLLNGDGIRFKGAWFYWLFADRIGRLILGYWGLGLLVPGIIYKKRKENWVFYIWLLGIVGYLATIATGNVRHDYYQIFTVPILSIFLAKGIGLILDYTGKVFNHVLSYSVIALTIIFSLMFGWYFIKDYYNINHPEIVEAGRAVEMKTSDKALVIAPYNGDTAFLYQTGRKGWPIMQDTIENMIKKGAQYYVSVNYDDQTKSLLHEAQNIHNTKGYKVVDINDKYVIIQLVRDSQLPAR